MTNPTIEPTLGVFLDFESIHPEDLDTSPLSTTLPTWRFHPRTEPHQVLARIADADVVVSNKVVLDRPTLEQLPRLRLICVAATGTNNIDLRAAAEYGIAVRNVTAYATPAVTQHVFALLLTLVTGLDDYRSAARDGRWAASSQFCVLDFPIAELSGKSLGIVGWGELGQGVARVAEAFGMHVLVAERRGRSPRPGRTRFEQVLHQADVLSLHCPLTNDTRNLIGEAELRTMKPSALLINTARGGIVHEAALARALRDGTIAAAGFDVLAAEPPNASNPLLAEDLPNFILTPHCAWGSREARQRLLEGVARNVRSGLGHTD